MNPPQLPEPALGSVRSIEAVLTTACNLSCSYCYQNRREARTMAWHVLEAVIDRLAMSHHPAPKLSLMGGEPLLALNLMERAAATLEARGRAGRRVGLFTSTNGTLLYGRAVSFLAHHDVDTQISFDGPAQDRRAPGTREIVERNLSRLADREPEFFHNRCSITITLGSHNVECLADAFHDLLERGVTEIAVAPLFTHDPGWTTDSIEELARQMATILGTSLEILDATGEVPFSAFRPPEDDAPGQPMAPGALCHAGCTDRLTVDVDGRIFGCTLLAESYQDPPDSPLGATLANLGLGSVDSPEFEQRLSVFPTAVRNTTLFDRKQNKHSTYGRCAECRFVDVCGICPVAIAHIPGNTDPHRVPDQQCAFNLVLLSCLEHFLTTASPAAQHRQSV